MRTDHYVGLVRHERGVWAAYRGVGSTLTAVRPPLGPCPTCGEVHESRRAAERAHGKKRGRDAQRPGVWESAQAALDGLLAELGPLYLRAAARARADGEPVPPLLIVPPIPEGVSAWDGLVEALDAVDDLGTGGEDAEPGPT